MPRLFCLLIVLLTVGPAVADPPSVANLVKQLGDDRFARREAAQKELLRRGEGIVPELDRLALRADAETAERLRKIRYELVGYLDDIKRLLPAVDNRPDYVPEPISDELRGLIAGHQPRAGDFLLDLVADPKHPLHLRATRAFLQTWQSATAIQLDRFIQLRVYLTTEHRPKFPAKVGAMIPMESKIRAGWEGWFPQVGETLAIRTRTTRYLDGKPYEKPFEYRYPFATVGWYKVGELAEGKHTIHAVMEYEFTHRGEKRKGTIRSKESQFEVVSADTPDDLIAPKSEERSERVKSAFLIRETDLNRSDKLPGGRVVLSDDADVWAPQVTWEVAGGRGGLHCPVWQLREPLDVDLCFDVEIRDNKTGKVYPADPIVVPRGERGSGYLIPRDPRGFAKDRDGFRGVTIDLKPSRRLALTHPMIGQYFPDPIVRGELLMKVITPSAPVAPRK